MTQLKIGSRVITRKFETQNNCDWFQGLSKFVNKEGVIAAISSSGNYDVHDYYWPPSAVEPVEPPFQPEYGREYEFAYDPEFIGIIRAKFIGKDGNSFVAKINNACQYAPYDYCRPIKRSLEEKLREWFDDRKNPIGPTQEDAVTSLMRLLANHRTEPSDEEILTHWREHDSYSTLSVIATVRHFLSKP